MKKMMEMLSLQGLKARAGQKKPQSKTCATSAINMIFTLHWLTSVPKQKTYSQKSKIVVLARH